MRIIAILNPTAGSGRAGKCRTVVEAALRAAGLESEIWLTKAPGHAVELARRAAAQTETVCAVGGDGTIHEVSRGLIASKLSVHLGILPLGTGNDFIKMTGIARHPEEAARQLATAIPTPVDYGRVRWCSDETEGEHIFVNAVGIGFDAQAAIEAVSLKFLPGLAGYLAAVLRTLRRWVSPYVSMTIAPSLDEPLSLFYEGRLLLVTVGNGVSSGGMFYLTPQASITDGLLDVCAVEHISSLRILRFIPRALKGRHTSRPEVHSRQIHRLQLRSDAGLPIHTDGEIVTRHARQIDIEVVPGGLSLLMPTSGP